LHEISVQPLVQPQCFCGLHGCTGCTPYGGPACGATSSQPLRVGDGPQVAAAPTDPGWNRPPTIIPATSRTPAGNVTGRGCRYGRPCRPPTCQRNHTPGRNERLLKSSRHVGLSGAEIRSRPIRLRAGLPAVRATRPPVSTTPAGTTRYSRHGPLGLLETPPSPASTFPPCPNRFVALLDALTGLTAYLADRPPAW
jgi:hypothetical protein